MKTRYQLIKMLREIIKDEPRPNSMKNQLIRLKESNGITQPNVKSAKETI